VFYVLLKILRSCPEKAITQEANVCPAWSPCWRVTKFLQVCARRNFFAFLSTGCRRFLRNNRKAEPMNFCTFDLFATPTVHLPDARYLKDGVEA
jgi:hypothetical protein